MFTRRGLMRTGVLAGFGATLPIKMAYAATKNDNRLVVIVLRGAMDGLSVVVPYGDPAYAAARGRLALAPGAGAVKLDGLFALNGSLSQFGSAYGSGEALAVHAVASPARGRSHFDSQNVLETGGTAPYALSSGWLNRALSRLPQAQAIAVSTGMPMLLQGPAKVGSWSPTRLPQSDDDTLSRIARMYEADPVLHANFTEAQALNLLAANAGEGNMAMGGGAQGLTQMAKVAAKLIVDPAGPQFVVLDRGGWDTHAAQPGRLNVALTDLDAALGALQLGLGPLWAKTTVLCITEFGRTVAVNGTDGTDHGTGSCALLMGGAVRGGRVVTDWPGLQMAQRFEGRDLKPTLDIRAVIKGVLRDHIGLSEGDLTSVFPGSGAVAPLGGLIRV